jgi:hypothetical protein
MSKTLLKIISDCFDKINLYTNKKIVCEIQDEEILMDKMLSFNEITKDNIHNGILTVSIPRGIIGKICKVMLVSN